MTLSNAGAFAGVRYSNDRRGRKPVGRLNDFSIAAAIHLAAIRNDKYKYVRCAMRGLKLGALAYQ